MSGVLLWVSAIAAVIGVFASWFKERLKDGHNSRVRKAILIIAAASIVVVVLAAFNQYNAKRQAVTIRQAQLQLTVLQNLSVFRIEMLDSFWVLLKYSDTVYNYLEFEGARSSLNSLGHRLPAWEASASEIDRSELQESKAAFDRLQKIAREVLIQGVNISNTRSCATHSLGNKDTVCQVP